MSIELICVIVLIVALVLNQMRCNKIIDLYRKDVAFYRRHSDDWERMSEKWRSLYCEVRGVDPDELRDEARAQGSWYKGLLGELDIKEADK